MKSSELGSFIYPRSVAVPLASPEQVNWEAQRTQLAIARRAYELFRARGGEHGHDWEDWFQAESELLKPVPFVSSESEQRITVCANVLGFEARELRVAVEPFRITIIGERKVSRAESPDRILRVIELKQEILPARTTVRMKTGVLRLELIKAAKQVQASVA